MEVLDFIDEKLSEYRNFDKESTIPDSFIFAYGPFMCMYKNSSFEVDCDNICKENPNSWLNVMRYASYLIRKITNGISYKDAKELIKEFIIEVDRNFNNEPINTEKKQALFKFANDYLEIIRNTQKAKGEFESFITNAAPIVPYEQKPVRRKDLLFVDASEDFERADIGYSIVKFCGDKKIEDEIKNLLLNNIADILINYNLAITLYDRRNEFNLSKIDKLLLRRNDCKFEVQKYYALAIINFYNLQNNEEFMKLLEFYSKIGDFSKSTSYEAFENSILEMANYTSTNQAFEMWDDPLMDEYEKEAMSSLLTQHDQYKIDETLPKYDFGRLNDFINLKRFMQFEEYPNRIFVGSLEKSKVVNINNMGGDRNYYEMDNNTVACPFLDLRNYKVRVIVLHGDTNNISIIDDINEIY